MKNTNLAQLFIGLLVGVIVTVGFYSLNESDHRYAKNNSSSHMMPDGTMMNNVGMDMESQMHGMTMSLEGKTGDAFDKEFLSQMIVHHQGAVDMAQMVLKTSKRPELVKLANDIITAQNGEIKMMQDWQKMWFK